MFDIDRRDFIAGLGGVTAVSVMSHDARADALEEYLNDHWKPIETAIKNEALTAIAAILRCRTPDSGESVQMTFPVAR